MSTYTAPGARKNLPSAYDAQSLVFKRFAFDLANRSYAPASLPINTLLEFARVPGGLKLVPHLCSFRCPILDSNGSPTAYITVGSANDADGLVTSRVASGAAISLVGTSLDVVNGQFGARDSDVPLYVKLTAAAATASLTGLIYLDAVFRPYQDDDADVT